jgi:hypothetical protein
MSCSRQLTAVAHILLDCRSVLSYHFGRMSRQKKSAIGRIVEATLSVFILPIIIPLFAVALLLYGLHRVTLYLLIWLLWLPRGKDVLLVYSDSPIWHDHMTHEVLPILQSRAVVLNWSERNRWPKWSFAVHVFRSIGGGNEFVPMVAIFSPFRRAKVFRFWSAFKEWKRGNTEPINRLREDLLLTL